MHSQPINEDDRSMDSTVDIEANVSVQSDDSTPVVKNSPAADALTNIRAANQVSVNHVSHLYTIEAILGLSSSSGIHFLCRLNWNLI